MGRQRHQLRAVLTTIARKRRSGVVELEDLPPECRATTRRHRTPLEALERDAIVEALSNSGGDKAAAAGALGMSRATIYRESATSASSSQNETERASAASFPGDDPHPLESP